jgi:hypothetical protein
MTPYFPFLTREREEKRHFEFEGIAEMGVTGVILQFLTIVGHAA